MRGIFPPAIRLEALRGRRRSAACAKKTRHEALQTRMPIINWEHATYSIWITEQGLLKGQFFHRRGKFTPSEDISLFRSIFAWMGEPLGAGSALMPNDSSAFRSLRQFSAGYTSVAIATHCATAGALWRRRLARRGIQARLYYY
jgi:hypothetical protein